MNATNETYNGWTNRETWAAYLWLTNEEALYQEAIAIARHPFSGNRDIEDKVESLFEDLFTYENLTVDTYRMREDIGSIWRVDWRSIAQHLIEDAVQWGFTEVEA